MGVLGSLAAASMERRLGSSNLVLARIAVSLISITVTPLIGQLVALLFAACTIRGIAQSMS